MTLHIIIFLYQALNKNNSFKNWACSKAGWNKILWTSYELLYLDRDKYNIWQSRYTNQRLIKGFVSPVQVAWSSLELISSDVTVEPDNSEWAEPEVEFIGVDG